MTASELRYRGAPGSAELPPSTLPPLLAPVPGQNRPLSLCHRMARGAANYAKNFGLGVAAASLLITPISTGIGFLAQKMGFVQEIGSRSEVLGEMMANLGLPGGEAMANAACPIQEFVTQFNNYVAPFEPPFFLTVFRVKAAGIGIGGVAIPIFEEIVFRSLIQSVLLKRIPGYFVRKIAPEREVALDSTTAKVARSVLTAALFSAYHLGNLGTFPDVYVRLQVVTSFISGMGLCMLKEKGPGLLGAIGAHITNNILALKDIFTIC